MVLGAWRKTGSAIQGILRQFLLSRTHVIGDRIYIYDFVQFLHMFEGDYRVLLGGHRANPCKFEWLKFELFMKVCIDNLLI